MENLLFRAQAALHQLGVRGFKKAIVLAKQEKKASGRDPYALLKSAITAVPDEEKMKALSLEKEKGPVRFARLADMSRRAMKEDKRTNGHLTRLIKMRKAATEALPEGLQAAARLKDTTPFPVQRRVFTETAPIPNFQQKLRARRE